MNMKLVYIERVLYGNQKQASNAMAFVVNTVANTILKDTNITSELSVVDALTKYLQSIVSGDYLPTLSEKDIVELIVGMKSMKVLVEGNCVLRVRNINKTSPKVRFEFVKMSKDAHSDNLGIQGNKYWEGSEESAARDDKATIDAEMSDTKLGNVPGNTLVRLHDYRDKLLPMVTDEMRTQTSDTYELCLLAAKDYYSGK